MLRLGDLAKNLGDQAKAAALWGEARPLFERSLQAKNVVQIDARLADLEREHEATVEYLTELNVPITSLEDLSIASESVEGKEIDAGEKVMVTVAI
jgi:hypothetical protein